LINIINSENFLMSKLYLQNIANDISFDSLPAIWQNFDLKKFSKEKTLYDFQQKALENTLGILWKYYGDEDNYQEKEELTINSERKKSLFRVYQNNGLDKDFSYDLTKREGKKVAKLIAEYYPVVNNKIGFENFINRMAYWMATGSGKTLVIVRLLEILKNLIENKEIPANDILFLTYREDLIDQFKEFIQEFILSRNGFLFNFSATFTDPRDFITTVFNFNLVNFIQEGYGKHIYLSQEEIKAFKKKDDFSDIEKQKIVLKSLILLSYIRKFSRKIKKVKQSLYHSPLLLTLVNSVNIEDADLKLFFKELEKIGQGKINKRFFDEAKKEIIKYFSESNKMLIPEGKEFGFDKKLFKKIIYKDVLQDVFNSKTSGNIEVLTIPGNRQEMVFKLRTSEKPFALIKIGDISNWLKEQLEGYEINESFDNESVFKKINRDDSDINILMGSRSFYEGWDSNRPNLILYINIGIGSDAKKFVLQSVGRGVRIEPKKNERKRLLHLYNAKKIKERLFKRIKNYVLPLETLFVFGTNANALRETIKTLEEEKGDEHMLGSEIIKNIKAEELPLFIPLYRLASYTFAEKKKAQKFIISDEDFDLAKNYFNYLEDDRIILMYHESDIKTLNALRNSFANSEAYYRQETHPVLLNPSLALSQIINHFSLIPEEFDKFKKLEEEIVHFKKIKFLGKKGWDEFLAKVRIVRTYEEKEEAVRQLRLEFGKHRNIEKYDKDRGKIEKKYPQTAPFDGIEIKYVPNHYYFPLIISGKEKIDYLNHIITEKSEIRFIEKLERYLNKDDNLFTEYDWWLFSKLDEHTDEVYLPYYHRGHHKIEKFKPDFIFWLKKGKNYFILFIDPKSHKFTDYLDKVDWYSRLFEGDKRVKSFDHQRFKMKVYLFLDTDDKKAVSGEMYQKYWFDNIGSVLEKLNDDLPQTH